MLSFITFLQVLATKMLDQNLKKHVPGGLLQSLSFYFFFDFFSFAFFAFPYKIAK